MEFDSFLEKNHAFATMYEAILNADPVIAMSARTTHTLLQCGMDEPAELIPRFLEHWAPVDYVDRYLKRVHTIGKIQTVFNLTPNALTLCGDRLRVDRVDYDIALLLSICVTSHRARLMQKLQNFYASLPSREGALAIIGLGTGYEYVLARRHAPQYLAIGYDTDSEALKTANSFAVFANVSEGHHRHRDFISPPPAGEERQGYDAIVACELLEHVDEPAGVLAHIHSSLNPGGKAFVTMALNIAQEDHVFWYISTTQCIEQIHAAGFEILESEFIPVRATPNARVETGAPRGNYAAIITHSAAT